MKATDFFVQIIDSLQQKGVRLRGGGTPQTLFKVSVLMGFHQTVKFTFFICAEKKTNKKTTALMGNLTVCDKLHKVGRKVGKWIESGIQVRAKEAVQVAAAVVVNYSA